MPRSAEQFRQMQEKRKAKLLSAALYLFATEGFDATSIDEITKKARCAHGLFYHYYKDLNEVLVELLSNAKEKPNLLAPLSEAKEAGGLAGLKKLCQYYSGAAKAKKDEEAEYAKMLLQIRQHNKVNKSGIKGLDPYPVIKSLIKQGQANGEIIQIPTEQASEAFVNLVSGTLDQRIILGYKNNKEINADTLIKLFQIR